MTSNNGQSQEKFNVVQFFNDGTHEYVRRGVDAVEATNAVQHYTQSVAARMGIVNQVLITDMMDLTVFHWQDGKIIFPVFEKKVQ